jgi:hypothetical protein
MRYLSNTRRLGWAQLLDIKTNNRHETGLLEKMNVRQSIHGDD